MTNSQPRKEKAPHEAGHKENTKHPHSADLSAAAQRARLLAALRKGPVTTLEARREPDILHPAMRVLELREQGHDIQTVWTRQETYGGVRHRVARYVLNRKGGQHDAR